MYNDQMEVTVLWRGASSVPLDGSKRSGRESPFMRYNFMLFVAMLFALIPGIVSAGIRMSSRPRCPVRATLPANSRLPSATRTQAGTITQTGGKSSLSKERCWGPASSIPPCGRAALYAVAGRRSHSPVSKTGPHSCSRLGPWLWWQGDHRGPSTLSYRLRVSAGCPNKNLISSFS